MKDNEMTFSWTCNLTHQLFIKTWVQIPISLFPCSFWFVCLDGWVVGWLSQNVFEMCFVPCDDQWEQTVKDWTARTSQQKTLDPHILLFIAIVFVCGGLRIKTEKHNVWERERAWMGTNLLEVEIWCRQDLLKISDCSKFLKPSLQNA